MTQQCLFTEKTDAGKWVCSRCRRPSNFGGDVPPQRTCRFQIIDQPQPCPMDAVVQCLTPEGLTRLDRCRAANCGTMHRVNGAITCVGMQGKKCGWQAKWIRCLNREEEFGCGGWECPHWINEAASVAREA